MLKVEIKRVITINLKGNANFKMLNKDIITSISKVYNYLLI
jgi:hypothetical protein